MTRSGWTRCFSDRSPLGFALQQAGDGIVAEDLVQRFRTMLTERGLRVTHQRLAIYECLVTSEEHPSAEDIYEALRERVPGLSLATVYKTLNVLVEMGLALKLGFGDDVNRYEGNPEPHINLVCVRCKKFVDRDEERLLAIAETLRAESGFTLFSQRHEIYGLCPECQVQSKVDNHSA